MALYLQEVQRVKLRCMNYHAAKAYIINKLDRELSPRLYYHGKHHTLEVLKNAEELCRLEGIGEEDTLLVKTAALYHDAGFTATHVEHEQLGCALAEQTLPGFGYSNEHISAICGMIMATKIPQSPSNHLEEILCDADLDYLGRNDFSRIANTLFRELQTLGIVDDPNAWNRIQINFLRSHHFFTATTIARRNASKQCHLEALEKKIEEAPH